MFEYFILFFAGIGAGFVTGFMGASAVVIAVPLLFLFLDYNLFLAIGISLITDIIASSFAFIEYFKSKKVMMKEGLIFAFISFFSVFGGSYFTSYFNNNFLGLLTGVGIIIGSIQFIKGKTFDKNKIVSRFLQNKYLSYVIFALIIGLISGATGAGGGLMMIFFFRFILGFDLKSSIGTAIFSMIFVTLIGGVSHYILAPFDLKIILFTGLGAIIGSIFSAKYSLNLPEKKLSKYIGVILLILAVATIIKNIYLLVF